MEIPLSKLASSSAGHQAAGGRVEPLLGLGEELVLLSVDAGKHRVNDIVDLVHSAYGRPRDYSEAVANLEAMSLVTRSGLRHHLSTTDQAGVDARRRRVLHVVRDPTEPSDEDADLLVGLAAGTELKLHSGDHLRARHHISSLGHKRPLTRFVELVAKRFDADSMEALTERLLPPELSFEGSFDPGANHAAWMYAAVGAGGF